MGLFKKVFKPVRKVIKKIIPKEIRPFLPYIAAAFGPATGGLSFGAGLGSALGKRALIAAATSAATDENGNPLRAGMLAAAPGAISGGLGQIAQSSGAANILEYGDPGFFKQQGILGAAKGASMINDFGPLKTIGAQTAIDQAAKFAELNQEEIDKYNQSLLSEGMADKGSRRNAIYQIYMNTGAYEADDVNSMLDKYGYATGGRVNLAGGGLEKLMLNMDTSRFPKGSGKSITRKFKNQVPTIDELISEEEEMDPKDKIIASLTDKLDEDEYKEFDRSLNIGAKGLESLSKSGHSMEPVPMLRFATGGEVIEEEEVGDFSIEGQTAGLLRNMIRENGYAGTMTMWNNYKDMMRQGEINMGFEEFINQHGDMFGGAQGGLAMARGGEVIEESETLMAGGPYKSGRDVQDAFNVWSGMGSDDKSLFEGFLDFYKQGSWRDQIMGQADVEENTMMASLETGQQNTLENIYEDLLADGLSPDAAAKKAMEIFRNMGKAEGGIMNRNLLNTGVDKDMRGGGFIPEGTKEKADDVPARLSKNEFVMTADAVKAAGGGSVNKGAQRMYNIMNQLEAQV